MWIFSFCIHLANGEQPIVTLLSQFTVVESTQALMPIKKREVALELDVGVDSFYSL